MADLRDLSWSLGIQVSQGKDAILLSHSTYVSWLLAGFVMEYCKPIKTPTAMNCKKELKLAKHLLNDSEKQIYQSLIGSFVWAMT